MIFSLDVIRARKGDCLILHYGSADDPKLIMIDGGPKQVYKPHLRPRLEKIRTDRGLAKNDPLVVDMLMVSHVDDDHIQGILDLTRELKTAGMDQAAQLVQVLSIWHNSFDNIIDSTPTELTASFTQQFGPASMNGDPPDDLTLDPVDQGLDDKDVLANLKVLASIQQGAQLRADAEALEFPLNAEFDGKLIMATGKGKSIDMENGLEFTVIGPMKPELAALQKKHVQWLKELKAKGIKPEEALSAYVDNSIPNLSSIVVMAEADGKRILFTGDARGDKILTGLELSGLMKKGGKIHIDVLKGPHHGSDNNLDADFFERITADHYVFSGNGEHGNPERNSVEMLLTARGDDDYEVHLTYPIKEIDAGRKADWEKEQAKEQSKKKKNPKQKIRANWSPAKQGLEALLKKEKAFAKKFRFVDEGEPHLIELLDKM
ncbi:MAG TPA: hypothetical protein VI306_23395 [Pyrinomonadaceae bacterium]